MNWRVASGDTFFFSRLTGLRELTNNPIILMVELVAPNSNSNSAPTSLRTVIDAHTHTGSQSGFIKWPTRLTHSPLKASAAAAAARSDPRRLSLAPVSEPGARANANQVPVVVVSISQSDAPVRCVVCIPAPRLLARECKQSGNLASLRADEFRLLAACHSLAARSLACLLSASPICASSYGTARYN